MGLSASMWTSVSGLLAHGNKMNLVGNNIANVSTIGFKSQRMDFNDYLYMRRQRLLRRAQDRQRPEVLHPRGRLLF